MPYFYSEIRCKMKALLGLPEPCLHTAVLYKWQPVSCLDLTLLPGEQAPPSLGAVAWAISQTLCSVSALCSLVLWRLWSCILASPVFTSGLVHVSSPCGAFHLSSPFLCPSRAGTLTLRNDLDGCLHFLRTSLWWGGGTLLFCVAVYLHLSRTTSSFSGAYWRVSTLLLLLSHHSFNKQVHLFCS